MEGSMKKVEVEGREISGSLGQCQPCPFLEGQLQDHRSSWQTPALGSAMQRLVLRPTATLPALRLGFVKCYNCASHLTCDAKNLHGLHPKVLSLHGSFLA